MVLPKVLNALKNCKRKPKKFNVLLDRAALWGPLNGLEDIHDELESLAKGGVLEAQSLARIRSWLYAFDSWINFPQEFAGKHFKNALTQLFCSERFVKNIRPSADTRR